MNEAAVRQVVEPALDPLGLELESIEILPAGKRSLVRITVDGDGPQGRGPSLDEIAEATKAISVALDDSTATGNGPYTLEVSSRGTTRPLSEPKHWRRNQGRLVKITDTEGDVVEGRIIGSDDNEVILSIAGEKKKDPDTERTLAYAGIAKAVVQVEFRKDPESDENGAE